MKINAKQTSSRLVGGLGPLNENRRMDATRTPLTPEEPAGDRVFLSAAAREVQEAVRQIRTISDGPNEAVATLKEQIQGNAYPFDFHIVARKIMKEQLALQTL